MKRPAVVIATAVSLAVLAPTADASCVRFTDRQKLARADAVFVGRVTYVDKSGKSARFQVLSVRKGRVMAGSLVRVVAEPYPSSITIAWTPKRGQRWRVYVDRKGRTWTTNDCMGTRRV